MMQQLPTVTSPWLHIHKGRRKTQEAQNSKIGTDGSSQNITPIPESSCETSPKKLIFDIEN